MTRFVPIEMNDNTAYDCLHGYLVGISLTAWIVVSLNGLAITISGPRE